MIDHSRKLLFIHIARTGGTSIETAICGKDWWLIDSESKHISASQSRVLYGEEIWESYHKFSIVRNPWDRLLSMWITKWWNIEKLQSNCKFKEFIQNVSPHPNEKYNSLFYWEILGEEGIEVLKFEDLENEFYTFLRSKKLTEVSLPHVEARQHKHYLEYYDEESLDYVEKKFLKDIVNFDYERPKI